MNAARCKSRPISSLKVVGSLLFGMGLAWTASCRQAPRWGTPEFNAKLVRLLMAHRCEKAIAVLQAANARHDPKWYAWLITVELDCSAKFGHATALRLVNEGIERFPKSSELVFLKGFVNGRMGERGVAQRYYADALKLALANIAADPDGSHTRDDQRVARNAEANLDPAWRTIK